MFDEWEKQDDYMIFVERDEWFADQVSLIHMIIENVHRRIDWI